jgi:Na+-transporting NADH:ubiquinone oxidoreductase subunit NqrC
MSQIENPKTENNKKIEKSKNNENKENNENKYVIIVVVVTSFLSAFLTSAISVALPSIANQFNISGITQN